MNRLSFAALVSALLLVPAAGQALPRDTASSDRAGAEARAHAHVARHAVAVAADGTEPSRRATWWSTPTAPSTSASTATGRGCAWSAATPWSTPGGSLPRRQPHPGRHGPGRHHQHRAGGRGGPAGLGDLPLPGRRRQQPELVIDARGPARLAHEVVVFGARRDGTPSELHVFVDAHSGEVLESWEGVQDAAAPASASSSARCRSRPRWSAAATSSPTRPAATSTPST